MPAAASKARLIPAAILAIFVYGMIASIAGTIIPEVSQRFALSPEQIGNVFLAQAVGLIIASVSVGPLLDTKGKKTGLLLGLSLIVVALFAVPNSSGYYTIMAFILVLGLGGGIIVTAANALVSDISRERRASMLNLLNLFFGLGALATPFIGANLFHQNSVALCYLIAGLTAATLVLHILTPMPPPTGERGFKFTEAGPLLGRLSLFLLSFLLFLYVSCEVGVWNWLPKHLMAQGIAESTALNILSLGFALGLLIGRIVVSRILIRIPASTVTLFAAILMAITTYGMLQTSDATIAAVLVFCAGVAMAPVFPTTLAMIGDAFPRMTATAMGMAITTGWIGLAFSSRIIGAVAGTDTTRLKTALLVLPACSVIMVIVNLAVRPMLKPEHKMAA
ncbi:MAG TPA: MFS transporter [Bryobacteraceae bacterium]|nr:MFS transporter [Bryobacteraceae bacterium]